MDNLVLGIILGLWVGIGQVIALSGLSINNILWSSCFAGLLVGDIPMGLQVGSTCLLMNLGFYTYGGATTPDYVVGSIFGTVIASRTGNYDVGLTVAVTLSLLMSQMDILGRATTTVFQHLGEAALAKDDIGRFQVVTLLGTLPWMLSRFLPTFLGMLVIDSVEVLADFASSVQWISKGLSVVGAALPAVGFALLLSYMDIKRFWPFMLIGYIGYGYLGLNTIALALVGAALAALFMKNYKGGQA